MDTIRILHTGDMHLGSPFASLSNTTALVRKNELESTCSDIIRKSSEYDIVLLTGDIFDSGNVEYETADIILNLISNSKKTRFFWSCGNHDPYNSRIMEYCRVHCPGNLHIFSCDTIEKIVIPESGVAIYGRSFKNNYATTSFLSEFGYVENPEYINILCMHSELSDSSKSVYNPVTPVQIANGRFDYAALGHVHSFSGILKSGETLYSYCGCPEGRGWDECGDKGYVSIEIDNTGIQSHFVSTAKRKYICEKIDVSDIDNYNEILSVMNDIVGSGNICKIEFIGENHISAFLNTEYIEQSANVFYAECIDNTHPAVNLEELKNEITLKGICASKTLKMIKEANSDEERELIRKAFVLLNDEFDRC